MRVTERPKLAAKARLKHDRHADEWLLLYPERGRVLNETAAAIMRCCDGTRTIDDIVDLLSLEYAAPRDELERDVRQVLEELARDRLLV